MGQTLSDENQCEPREIEDVGDLEINSASETGTGTAKKGDKTITSGTSGNVSNNKKQDKKFSTTTKEQQHVRKLSIVSHRNIQLLSLKPRSEKETFVEELRTRRRSSLINLIFGAPSSGPRFSDDLCSLSSHLSECNFGIEFFPDTYHAATSTSSLRLGSIENIERADRRVETQTTNQKQHGRRRSSSGSLNGSVGGLVAQLGLVSDNPSGDAVTTTTTSKLEDASQRDKKLIQVQGAANYAARQKRQQFRKPSLASTLASIDLTSSFEQQNDKLEKKFSSFKPTLSSKEAIFESSSTSIQDPNKDLKTRASAGARVNQSGRCLRRTASELSLYSTISGGSSGSSNGSFGQRNSISSATTNHNKKQSINSLKETKLIIILQVCLPFILAGFGNMAAGLVLNRVAHWEAFKHVPIFFVLLPPLVGMKGNIEMTLASRLSTLSNLNMLDTSYQRRRAFVSNLILILSQAIGLSIFASLVSVLCEFLMAGSSTFESDLGKVIEIAILVVLASALATSVTLVLISSIMMSVAVAFAHLIQVNPDNLSTLIAALYGDVLFVLVYGVYSNWMYSLRELNILIWPLLIIFVTLASWPILMFMAYKLKETHSIALTSLPPMLTSIMVSMGSGAVLSLVVSQFKLIALYQPVVNGFGANLIAVQASRVSTWLWCSALRKISITRAYVDGPRKTLASLASFTDPDIQAEEQKNPFSLSCSQLLNLIKSLTKKLLWSFCNSSPNSIAARMLLVMIIPAHTIYFIVIWLVSPANYIVITWQFYLIYIALCLLQVFLLLTICEPLMTLLMNRNLDPDVFGISLLMALADLTGTLCLTGAFFILAGIGDINASKLEQITTRLH